MSNASRFTTVNSYAAMRGFGAGFPNFQEADYGYGVVYGTYFLNAAEYDFQDVPVASYGAGGADRMNVPAMMRAANDFVVPMPAYGAALPTFHIGADANGPVYGTILIKKSAVEFRDVKKSDLGGVALSNVGDMFRAVDNYATTQGYAAAFP